MKAHGKQKPIRLVRDLLHELCEIRIYYYATLRQTDSNTATACIIRSPAKTVQITLSTLRQNSPDKILFFAKLEPVQDEPNKDASYGPLVNTEV